MRKKTILGNFVLYPDVAYTHTITKLTSEPEAYSALITFLPGCRQLNVDIGGKEFRLADAGCKWLMYLPMNEYWCLSTYYAPDNRLLGWYFDISRGNFMDENGMPCTDDIFLDYAIDPSGQGATLDADELQEALDSGEVTTDDYNHAYNIRDSIKGSQWSDVEFLKDFSARLLADYVV